MDLQRQPDLLPLSHRICPDGVGSLPANAGKGGRRMTLLELSALYDESATRIRVRMAQLRADAKEQTDPAAAQALRQRIAELTPLLREMRELATC